MNTPRTHRIHIPEDAPVDELAVWKAAARLREGAPEPLDELRVSFATEAEAFMHREWMEKIGVVIEVREGEGPPIDVAPPPPARPSPPPPPVSRPEPSEPGRREQPERAHSPKQPPRPERVPDAFVVAEALERLTPTDDPNAQANRQAIMAGIFLVVGCCGCTPAGILSVLVGLAALSGGATGGHRALALASVALGAISTLFFLSVMLAG